MYDSFPLAWRSKMNLSKRHLARRRLKRAGELALSFRSARQGFVALEFALIAPVMLMLFFGVVELSDAYAANAKVSTVVGTAADLPAQEKQLCNAEVTDIFKALDAIIFPYPAEDLGVVISSIAVVSGSTRVQWSDAHNASPRGVNSMVTIPSNLITPGGSVIMAEVTYTYHSPAGHLIPTSVNMSKKYYVQPRLAAQIPRSASTC